MTDFSALAGGIVRLAERARALHDRMLVVKLGGSAMEEPAATRGTLEAVAALRSLGVKLILVHGGGKPIDRAMEAAGLTPVKIAGRRTTDDATMGIVERVLTEINAGLVAQLRALGTDAVPLLDALGGERLMLPGVDLAPIDLGRVGKITAVREVELEDLADHGTVPVIPSMARDTDGGRLNVNADTVAAAIAGAVEAEACVFLTDTPGVLRNVADASSRIAKLTRAECDALIDDGTIAGGMLPKVEACFEALDAGAGMAIILDGRRPHALLAWFLGEPSGTTIVS